MVFGQTPSRYIISRVLKCVLHDPVGYVTQGYQPGIVVCMADGFEDIAIRYLIFFDVMCYLLPWDAFIRRVVPNDVRYGNQDARFFLCPDLFFTLAFAH